MKIINNADDYGYSNAINYGIIDAYKFGFLTSTTIMANMGGFDHAIKLAKENPGLGVGVHLTLTCGQPLLKDCKTLADEKGDFKKISFYKDDSTSVDDNEVYNEWRAQIQKVIDAGIQPTHLDSHHHSHTYKNNIQIIIRLAHEFNLPVRNSFQDKNVYTSQGINSTDLLINPWHDEVENMKGNVTQGIIARITKELEDNKDLDVIEVMWHPAYLDKKIMTESSFNMPRIHEVAALLDDEFNKYLKSNYTMVTYQDI